MRFYNQQHKHYCGIDLHARKMYVCILTAKGKVVVHQNIKTDPEAFFELIFPYIDDIAVGVERVFAGTGLRTCAPSTISALSLVMHYT